MSESNSTLTIKRVDAMGAYRISHSNFVSDMISAGRYGHEVSAWTGETRDGSPITVVWVTGHRSGRMLSAFELPGGE